MKVMRQLSSLAAGVAIAAFAGVGLAQADGGPGKRAVYEKSWDWGGLYFGVHSGWQWSTDVTITPGYTVDHDSAIVGGQIGLQHQFGQIVLGVEGNLTTTFQNNSGSTPCGLPFTCAARLDDILTIGARLGFAAGKWMPYITGGYANAAFHHHMRTLGTQVTVEEARARLSGWYVGGGVEMALSHGWTVGLEYRHYEFDPNDVPGFTPAGTFTLPATFDATTDTFTVRASWKLGRPERVVPLK